jgi:hypothetical protein
LIDVWFPAVLFVANAIVALLNAHAYGKTADTRDLAATIAWGGSTAYWLTRLILEVGT